MPALLRRLADVCEEHWVHEAKLVLVKGTGAESEDVELVDGPLDSQGVRPGDTVLALKRRRAPRMTSASMDPEPGPTANDIAAVLGHKPKVHGAAGEAPRRADYARTRRSRGPQLNVPGPAVSLVKGFARVPRKAVEMPAVRVRLLSGKSFEVQAGDRDQLLRRLADVCEEHWVHEAKLVLVKGTGAESEDVELVDGPLDSQGVRPGDTVLALKRRRAPRMTSASMDPEPGPTANDIAAVLGHKPKEAGSVRLQISDLMAALAGISAAARAAGEPDGEEEEAPSSPAAPPEPDAQAVRLFTDMGFPEARTRKALVLSGNNTQRAMDWLLSHADDPNADRPLTEAELAALTAPARPHRPPAASSSSGPDPELVRRLVEMGFPESDAQQALQATRNRFEAACSWLLGDRSVVESLEELENAALS
eukprot:tig00020710_g13255.t1